MNDVSKDFKIAMINMLKKRKGIMNKIYKEMDYLNRNYELSVYSRTEEYKICD
jgi:hypothetical protein